MTEPRPTYIDPTPTEPRPLPERAYNLARRVLELEKRHNGRVRIQVDLLIVDGEWWLDIIQPGRLERLGE